MFPKIVGQFQTWQRKRQVPAKVQRRKGLRNLYLCCFLCAFTEASFVMLDRHQNFKLTHYLSNVSFNKFYNQLVECQR